MTPTPTLVLLPGLNGTDGLFAPLLQCKPAGIHTLCVTYPSNRKLSYSQLKDWVLSKIANIDSPFVLLGESFSGPLALMVANTRPKHLKGIILVATFVSSPGPKIGRYLPWQLGFKMVRPLYRIRSALSRQATRKLVHMIRVELEKVDPQVMADRVQSTFSVDVTQELVTCELPMMYFRGRHDFVVPARNLKYILQNKPEVAVDTFDTQHFLLQSHPQQAWRAIIGFIASIAPSH